MANTVLTQEDTFKVVTEEWNEKTGELVLRLNRNKMVEYAKKHGITAWQSKPSAPKEYFFPAYEHQASGIRISRNGAIGVSETLPETKDSLAGLKKTLESLTAEQRALLLSKLQEA